MKIEAVVFDLDNTIYPESEYFEKVLIAFSKEISIPIDIFNDIFKNFDDYRANKPNIFKFILNSVNLFNDQNYDLLFEIYTTLNTQIYPYKNIEQGIIDLIDANIRVGVLTNGVIQSQHNKWKSLDLKMKDQLFFKAAREYGNDKPSSQSFDAFLSEFKIQYQNTFFIGDKYKNDLEYPISKGGKGILIGTEKPLDKIELCYEHTAEAIQLVLTLNA